MKTNRYFYCAHRPWNIRRFYDAKTLLSGEWKLITEQEMLSIEEVLNWKPDKIFLLDWSWKIPSSITNAVECIGLHPTDLPYGRGGSPYQNLILRKQYTSVLSAFRMINEIDAGPIYLKKPIYLFGSAIEFFDRVSQTAIEMIQEIIEKGMSPIPQQGEVITFRRRTERDNQMNEDLKDLASIYDFIRMLDAPTYPSAYFDRGRFRFIFSRACFQGESIEANVKIILRKEDEL